MTRQRSAFLPISGAFHLGAAAGLCALLAACGGKASDGVSAPEPGEELPGGDTTNTLLLGGNAFTMPAANISIALLSSLSRRRGAHHR